MKNLRIGPRLLAAFGIVVALTISMGLYALYKQSMLHYWSEQMTSRDFAVLDNLRGITQSEDQMRATREMVILSAALRKLNMPTDDLQLRARQWFEYRDRNLKLLGDLEAGAASWENASITAGRGAIWRRIRNAARDCADALKAISPEAERQYALVGEGRLADAVAQTANIERAVGVYQARLADARRAVEDQIGLGRSEMSALAEGSRNSVIAAVAITALVGIFCALFIQRSITAPLADFMRIAENIGQGDLTQQAPATGKDELADLGRSFNRMVAGLREVASQTRSVVENLNAATAEILASTQQQAASTAEQAAAVQQANATMAEISQSGAQISDRARQVAATAEATSTASAAGIQSVQNTASIMESIRQQAEAVAENVIALSDKTQAVGEVISTVDDISEESHLLALKAAIQAAAAGEHGRSFAVVASEMKNLAAQSKQATVQVRSILGDIQKAITSSVMLTEEAVKRVEAGRQQADVADRTIRELTDNIEESVRAFQQIVGGSSQQQIGFEQVTQAFRNIGIASQETAASTKQSEKAAANLNALSLQLRAAVEKYRI
jgi:methyl-accepting chemotaxis protein